MTAVDSLLEAVENEERAVLFTVIEGEGSARMPSSSKVVSAHGDGIPEAALGQAEQLIREHTNRVLELDGASVFAEVYGPPPAC